MSADVTAPSQVASSFPLSARAVLDNLLHDAEKACPDHVPHSARNLHGW